MPVINVNYKINNTYINYNKTIECLDIEIITNGSITPEKALSEAAEKLTIWFNSLIYIEKDLKNEDNIDNEKVLPQFDQILIEELQLPIRAYNCLKRAGINSIGQLLKYSQEEIKEIKNFGKKSADQLFETLKNKFNILLSSSKS
jgi:DNA-directed RNA polymerase subunit alpha